MHKYQPWGMDHKWLLTVAHLWLVHNRNDRSRVMSQIESSCGWHSMLERRSWGWAWSLLCFILLPFLPELWRPTAIASVTSSEIYTLHISLLCTSQWMLFTMAFSTCPWLINSYFLQLFCWLVLKDVKWWHAQKVAVLLWLLSLSSFSYYNPPPIKLQHANFGKQYNYWTLARETDIIKRSE